MSLTKASYSMITGAPANVLDYGAVGDGVTDDSAAINLALAGGNKIVYFPPGTYYIYAEDVVIPSNTVIEGGFATIKYGKSPSRPYITRIYIDNATNVRVQNLRVDGNYSVWTNASVYTLQIYDSTDITITGCEIFNGLGSGIDVSQSDDQGATNKRMLFDNNYIHDIGSAAIGGFYAYGNGISVTGGQDIVIRNNNIQNIYGVGAIDLEGRLQNNIQIVGNRIRGTSGNAAGIKLYAGGVDVASNYIVIRDNILNLLSTDSSPTAEPAIWIQAGGNGVSITGNQIYDANAGGIVVQTGNEVFLDNNSIRTSPKAGFFINSAQQIKCTNNILLSDPSYDTSSLFYIESNATTTGTCLVTGNTIVNAPATAFTLNFRGPGIFQNNSIVDCRSNGTKGYGVGTDIGFANALIGGNTIRDTLEDHTSRFFGFYNFSGTGNHQMVYTADKWFIDATDTLVKFDVFGNTNFINTDQPLVSSFPTGGGYNYVGQLVWNASAASGGTPGWVCTTAGTPGTWKAMANLA
jgi:hypothetical protein